MMMLIKAYIIFLACNLVKCGLRSTAVLEIPQGRIQGLETLRGDYKKYIGIPYATVPERFGDPGPAPTWSGTFNATRDRLCMQYHDRLGFPIGDEDCLVLSVYTPGQVSFKNPLPVMVYIHGGEYYRGQNNNFMYNPETIVKKNVIVVTITYRLGAFGFLCLRIKGASGNAGLKDQMAALTWIKQNIRYFGGDPQTVTIFGESAGAASAHMLILSKESKGLFRRVIMESGSALSPFAFTYEPIERASLVAANMGYSTKNPFELLKIFKNATAKEIILASQLNTGSIDLMSQYVFRPCAEKQVYGSKSFMTKSPKQLLDSGNYNRVITIIGYNDKEGIFHTGSFDKATLAQIDQNFESVLPDNLYFPNADQKSNIASEIRDFYFSDKPIDMKTIDNLTDYLTDMLYHYGSEMTTEYQLQNTNLPVYNYYFQYDSYRNLGKIFAGGKEMKGAAHTDELFYLFQPIVVWPLAKVKKDMSIVEKITTMWTNFAKYGDPTSMQTTILPVRWEASSNDSLRYLQIDSEFKMIPMPNPKRIDFWKNIYSKYGIN